MRSAIQLDETGQPDDIWVACDGVHIERLNDDVWWIGITRNGTRERVALTITACADFVARCSLIENGLGVKTV